LKSIDNRANVPPQSGGGLWHWGRVFGDFRESEK